MAKKNKKKYTQNSVISESASFVWRREYSWVLLAGIVVLGAVLRLTNLGYLSLWGDELNHVYGAQSLINNGSPDLPSGQPYTYAYAFTWLVSLMDRLAGSSEYSNRLVAVVFGLLSIFATYFTATFYFKDRRVGLIAALLMAVLPWYIIRSRIVRMYTMFQFLYLVFAYLFYRGFEKKGTDTTEDESLSWWHGLRLNIWYLAGAAAVLYFAFTIQSFAFEAAPSIFIYCLVSLIVLIKRHGFVAVKTGKYALVVYVSVAGLIAAPFMFGRLAHVPFEALMPSWDFFIKRVTEEPFWALKRYFVDTLYHLHPLVWIIGLIGFIGVWVRPRKSYMYVTALFLTPFLIQSLIFNNPGAVKAQYLFFAFPFFLMLCAYGYVVISDFISKKINRLDHDSARHWITASLVIVTVMVPLKQAFSFVQQKKHGDINDRSTEQYANWREACQFVQNRAQKGEVVLTTQPWSVQYYLGRVDYYVRMGFNDKLMLREEYKTEENFRGNPNSPLWPIRDLYSGTPMLRDYNSLVWMLDRNPRGWLVGCHKLFNPAFVDKRALTFINKNMKRVYVDKDRSIVVYYWNFNGSSAPLYRVTSLASYTHSMTLPDPRRLRGKVRLQIDVEGLSAAESMAIRFNGVAELAWQKVDDSNRQVIEVVIPTTLLRAGKNTVDFVGTIGEDGYTIYHIGMTFKQGAIDYTIF